MRWCCLVLFAIVGCGKPAATVPVDFSTRKIKVLATTGMIADAARAVGGDFVDVETLMGPGVDPHQYRATPGDNRKLEAADLVLYNGLHLEGKMADVLEHMTGKTRSVAVTRGFDVHAGLRAAPEGYEGVHDPHVWFDVSLWIKAVDNVRAAYTELDPTRASAYQYQAIGYTSKLKELHEEVKRKAASIPSERRTLVTAHDAFFYFGQAYGFEVHGLQGVSTASEVKTNDVQRLAQLLGSRKIPAIFGETSVPDKSLQAVVAAAEKDFGHKVKFIPGELYSDALGDAGTPAATYIGMVRHNIDTIVAALK